MTAHCFVVTLFAFTKDVDEEVFSTDIIFNPSSVKSWEDLRQKSAKHFANTASTFDFDYDDDFSKFPLPDNKFEDVQKGDLGSLRIVSSVIGKIKNSK